MREGEGVRECGREGRGGGVCEGGGGERERECVREGGGGERERARKEGGREREGVWKASRGRCVREETITSEAPTSNT